MKISTVYARVHVTAIFVCSPSSSHLSLLCCVKVWYVLTTFPQIPYNSFQHLWEIGGTGRKLERRNNKEATMLLLNSHSLSVLHRHSWVWDLYGHMKHHAQKCFMFAYYCAIVILKFKIILPLNLCFVSEVQWDNGAYMWAEEISVVCVSTTPSHPIHI